MYQENFISVIIPAHNEEEALPQVLSRIPHWVDQVLVVNNASTDGTVKVATQNGATVIDEPARGYGRACLAGVANLSPLCSIVVFLDGDFSDDPTQMESLVTPLTENRFDLALSTRMTGLAEPGALPPQVRWGNALAVRWAQFLFGCKFTDLGPFRAIRYEALTKLEMQDLNFGWTIKMQVKAYCRNLRIIEIPVTYRKRIGTSKISGTLRGVIGAGSKILWSIFVLRFQESTANTIPINGVVLN